MTLEMGFDRFPRELFSEIADGFQSVGQLPIFLPWSGFIMVGAQLTRLIGDIGERLFESRPGFTRTETFNLPGFERPEARFRIITNPGFEDADHDADAGPARNLVNDRRSRSDSPAVSQWRVAETRLVLRNQINERFPGRSKLSDGAIGDSAHASSRSDHNPHIINNGVSVVTAMDITHDPSSGCHAGEIVDALIRSQDPRIKYIIYNREIISSYPWSGQPAWARRSYSGANPHKKHFHLSVLGETSRYDDTSDWSIA